MPGADGVSTICLDFDGTLVREGKGGAVRWAEGAREFVFGALADPEIRLVIHTCRATAHPARPAPAGEVEEFYRTGRASKDAERSWELRAELNAFMAKENLVGRLDVWEGPGKPLADVYIDDKAEQPDWARLAGELGVRLAREARPATAVGVPPILGPQR